MTTSSLPLVHHVFPPEGVVLAYDDEQVSYADLAVVSVLSGEWSPFIEASARGHSLITTEQVDGTDLRHAAERFRRARRLEAAEDLRDWLSVRGLTSVQWRHALQRSLMVPHGDGVEDEPTGSIHPLPSPDVLNADAFCTGLWERSSQRVTAWLAATSLEPEGRQLAHLGDTAAAAREVGVAPSRIETISRWWCAFESLRTRVASDEAVARLVRSRELEWTSFDFEDLTFATRSEACEALLCCRDDGLEPEDIVTRSDGRLTMRTARSDTLPPVVSAEFLTGDIDGRVVGPFETETGWSVLRLKGAAPTRCRGPGGPRGRGRGTPS